MSSYTRMSGMHDIEALGGPDGADARRESAGVFMSWRLALGLALVAFGLAMALSGCSGMRGAEPEAPAAPEPFLQPLAVGWEGDAMIAQNHVAADGMVANLVARLPRGARILCATFVSRDNFDESSSFGRLVGAQFVSRLSQAGFGVVEFRLRSEMGVRVREGEFALSRKTAQYMRENYDAHAILVGSYTVDRRVVFVSAQVVRLDTGVVVAAYDYAVPNEGAVARLLRGKEQPVDFAAYLRGRGASGAAASMGAGMGQGMGALDLGADFGAGLGTNLGTDLGAGLGGLDTGAMTQLPQRVPGPQPITGAEGGAGEGAETGGPIRLFPPTRLQ